MNSRLTVIILCLLTMTACFADENITINNNQPQQQQQQQQQQNNNNNNNCEASNAKETPPPGTYYQTNPKGGTDTVYTTGDKQPYNINGCNPNNNTVAPVIQPYISGPFPRPPR